MGWMTLMGEQPAGFVKRLFREPSCAYFFERTYAALPLLEGSESTYFVF